MDDLNRQIIDVLAAKARATNREIAQRLGVSEPTIAARIRHLLSANIIRVVLQRSIRSGPDPRNMAILDLFVDDASAIEPVGREIAAFPQVLTVYESSRRPEIVAHVYADTPQAMGELIMEIGERIDGLSRLNVSTVLSGQRYHDHIGNLSVPPVEPEPGTSPREKLLALLCRDARQTAKALARTLGLSETTVRHHVRMLEREGWKAALVCDAQSLGYDVWTELRLTVAAQHIRGALASLADIADITVTAHISGTANLMIFFSASNVIELDRFVRTHIRSMPGMLDFTIMRIPRVIKANYNTVM